MAAGQGVEHLMELVHGDQRGRVSRLGVGGHQVAVGAFFTVEGDAVAGEVEHDAVFRAYGLWDGFGEPFQNGGLFRIEQGGVDGVGVLLLQPLGDAQSVVDSRFQRGDVFVVVDADDEGMALLEGELGGLFFLGHGCGLLFNLVILSRYGKVPGMLLLR